MIRRILVPLDGSTRAEEILPHVAMLAKVFGSRLDLLHVLPSRNPSGGEGPRDPLSHRLARAERTRYLEAVAERLREAGLDTWTHVEDGGAAEVIVELLRRGEYDLLGLTPHGSGGGQHLRMGCTAVGIILNAQTSILVAPKRAGRRSHDSSSLATYHQILAPVDCSPRSDWSLGVASAIARGTGARLKVVHVLDAPEVVSRLPGSGAVHTHVASLMKENRREASRYMDEVVWRLKKPDLVVDGAIIEAPAGTAETLRDLASTEDADLVVLSAHGSGASPEWPLGGTAAKLVFWAQRPVLVIQDLPCERVRPELAARTVRARSLDS